MTVWIKRDKTGYSSRFVYWYMSKPEQYSPLSLPWKKWKAKDFKKEFGFMPRKGSCKEKIVLLGETDK